MNSTALMIAAGAFGILAAAGQAIANPLGGAAAAVQDGAPRLELLQVRHGRMTCVRGKDGWHYHTVRGDRVACAPRPRSAFVSWRCMRLKCGWYHRGQKRFF